MIDSPEDFEFVVQTTAGSRDVVISRTALSKLGSGSVICDRLAVVP